MCVVFVLLILVCCDFFVFFVLWLLGLLLFVVLVVWLFVVLYDSGSFGVVLGLSVVVSVVLFGVWCIWLVWNDIECCDGSLVCYW